MVFRSSIKPFIVTTSLCWVILGCGSSAEEAYTEPERAVLSKADNQRIVNNSPEQAKDITPVESQDESPEQPKSKTPELPEPETPEPEVVLPTISIDAYSIINGLNQGNYELEGSCSEDGEAVAISIDVLDLTTNCVSGSWALTSIDLSGIVDQENLTITANHTNNQNLAAAEQVAFVTKDTISPVASLGVLSNVSLNNASSYTVSGTCNEEQAQIVVSIASFSQSATCLSGSFTSAAFSLGGLADSSNQLVTVDITDLAGNAGSQVDSNIAIDTTAPVVSITSANLISAANVGGYSVVGTCSEDSSQVSLTVGTVSQNTLCGSGVWTVSSLDVSSLADGSVTVAAAHLDSFGNAAPVASVSVDKETSVPTVTISDAPNIVQTNVTEYSMSGSCSENGRTVAISLNSGALSYSPNCSGGTWSIGPVDLSSLADAGSIPITADLSNTLGVNAIQAQTTVEKDTALASVSVSTPSSISSGNQTAYQLSGSCSEDGVVVDIDIAGINLTPVCGSGVWTTGFQDVSTLSDGLIAISVDHDSADSLSLSVQKSTLTPSVENLTVAWTLSTIARLNWNLSDPGGFTIDDYVIQYRMSATSTWLPYADGVNVATYAEVNDLSASTSYQFRVAVSYDTGLQSDWSAIATGETKPDEPIFGAEYKAMNVGGATTANVVALEDDTNVTLNGSALATLNRGEVYNFTSSQFDVIEADKPIYTAGRRGSGSAANKGNMVFIPTSWAGKTFSFNAIRDSDQILSVYALEASTIEVYQGTTLLATTTIAANTGDTLSWSPHGSYQVVSTGTILAFHYSIGSAADRISDPKPLLPSSLEIIGIPSSSMRLTSDLNATNYNLWHSNSSTSSGSLNKSSVVSVSPQGTSNQYNPSSLLISADKVISGASFADSNGLCASVFLPTNLMQKRFAINANSDWVAFASKQAGIIEVYGPSQEVGVDTPVTTLTLTRSGSEANAPYKARLTGGLEGYRFISSVPVAAWYQPNNDSGVSDEDETILYGSD